MKTPAGSIVIALSVLIAAFILGNAYKYKFISTETIIVTGLAEKDFISDQIVWKGQYSRSGYDLKEAYTQIKSDEAIIKAYLKEKGIPDSSMVFLAVDVVKNFNYENGPNGTSKSVFSGYTLTGGVKVDSREIKLVEKVSREVTELLQKGIEFNSNKPSYYYSRLNELKIDLLAKAAEDAKLRAETIAKSSAVNLGSLKKANMGVFQITGKNDNEDYSYGGSFNTTSKEKTASITLKVEYLAN
ncbi:MAG: SIMPL domain-containing protein [Sphingobacteriia bacterium 28-36-52]|nr:MAG: SIMPL domain-containing protein [Sphingobacteriia bacterium 28-36-52]